MLLRHSWQPHFTGPSVTDSSHKVPCTRSPSAFWIVTPPIECISCKPACSCRPGLNIRCDFPFPPKRKLFHLNCLPVQVQTCRCRALSQPADGEVAVTSLADSRCLSEATQPSFPSTFATRFQLQYSFFTPPTCCPITLLIFLARSAAIRRPASPLQDQMLNLKALRIPRHPRAPMCPHHQSQTTCRATSKLPDHLQ